jgi:hypothetical protein
MSSGSKRSRHVGQIQSILDHPLVCLVLPPGSSAMHPSFVRLSSASARASTIGFIGLGRMGHEMALNLFSKTMVNYDLQHQASGSTSSSSNVLPRFTVCDVNEDAANNIVRVMRERFPGLNIAIRSTPAEYVPFAYFLVHGSELSVRIAASASTIITMLPSSPHVQVRSTKNNDPHLNDSSMAGRLPEDVGAPSSQHSQSCPRANRRCASIRQLWTSMLHVR